MKNSQRHITSMLMTIIYLVIVLSPLTPLFAHSRLVIHTVTGHCSGDCRIDGCSAERSAAHTCCCWQKKRNTRTASNRGECEVPSAETSLKRASCCAPSPPPVAPKINASCCAPESSEVAAKETGVTNAAEFSDQKKRATTISSKPCGSGNLFALLTTESYQHLPFFFAGCSASPVEIILTFVPPDSLTSRYCEPPDPPPIIS